MFLQLKGLRGQGDIYEQREIITGLAQNTNAKLCIVIEPCGNYRMQDDTAVDLNLRPQIINLMGRMSEIKEWPENIVDEIMMPIAEEIFQMEGLIVIDCWLRDFMVDAIMEAFKKYYFSKVLPNVHNKTHLIYILPSESKL